MINLNLAFYNANAVSSQRSKIEQFLVRPNIDIFLISETFLKPNQKFNLANFKIYRHHRDATRGRGTAILIKKSIRSDAINLTTFTSFEATGIQIFCDNSSIRLISFYKTPLSNLDENEFIQLFDQEMPRIVAGGFNSKHTDWGCRTTNTADRLLLSILKRQNFRLHLPDTFTHFHAPTNSWDLLDFAISSNLSASPLLLAKQELSSDHLPVVFTLNAPHVKKPGSFIH